MTRRDRIVAVFASLFLLVTGWLWLSTDGLTKAPAATFKTTDGRQLDLEEMRGRPVLVTFWATTCPGCIREMPHLIELYEEYSDDGLEIIGVAMSYDPPNQVMKMIEKREIPYPISLDIDGAIARSFDNVMLTPTTFLIAPDGTIVRHKVGELDMGRLRDQIRELLSRGLQANKKQEKFINEPEA